MSKVSKLILYFETAVVNVSQDDKRVNSVPHRDLEDHSNNLNPTRRHTVAIFKPPRSESLKRREREGGSEETKAGVPSSKTSGHHWVTPSQSVSGATTGIQSSSRPLIKCFTLILSDHTVIALQ